MSTQVNGVVEKVVVITGASSGIGRHRHVSDEFSTEGGLP